MTRPPDPQRLEFLMDTVEREGRHLLGTTTRLFSQTVDEAWVRALEDNPDLAERVDAFAARFGRMQDTIGEKLVPELLRHLLETPSSTLDNLNRMEKLGVLDSVADWVEARNLRNRLVHEYVRDPAEFADGLNRARKLVPLLVNTYNAANRYAATHFDWKGGSWPAELAFEN